MMESNDPKQFSNKVIAQLVKHLLGDALLEYHDYTAIRVVYRALGGSWSSLLAGEQQAMALLKQVVIGWGKLPDRALDKHRVI